MLQYIYKRTRDYKDKYLLIYPFYIYILQKMSSTSMIVVTSIISGIIMLLLAYTCAYDPSICMLHVHIRCIILLCENKIAQDLCVVCR